MGYFVFTYPKHCNNFTTVILKRRQNKKTNRQNIKITLHCTRLNVYLLVKIRK